MICPCSLPPAGYVEDEAENPGRTEYRFTWIQLVKGNFVFLRNMFAKYKPARKLRPRGRPFGIDNDSDVVALMYADVARRHHGLCKCDQSILRDTCTANILAEKIPVTRPSSIAR